jgi:hypothetical protein
MDDLEATFASFFRASSSSSGLSIVVETGANFGNLLSYFALCCSCSGRTKSVRKETMNRLSSRVYVTMISRLV